MANSVGISSPYDFKSDDMHHPPTYRLQLRKIYDSDQDVCCSFDPRPNISLRRKAMICTIHLRIDYSYLKYMIQIKMVAII